ncbi:hypothetical protein TNCV_1722691 [Trichonephila clavipes]|nr:hypothetical protein TNCV_1722691 [Trichonephila clavipes]
MERKGNILQSPALVIQPTRLLDPLFNEHVLRVYSEGIGWHRASSPGLPVWSPMLYPLGYPRPIPNIE